MTYLHIRIVEKMAVIMSCGMRVDVQLSIQVETSLIPSVRVKNFQESQLDIFSSVRVRIARDSP